MLSDDNLPALQITIHATTSNDLPTVLHALNTHHLTTDYTADDTHPLTDLQPGHTYVTRAGADTAEHLATTLITTAPHTVFELVNDPHETQEGTYIGHVPGTGTYRAQCNADGDPLVPADALAQALANAPRTLSVEMWLAADAPNLLGTRIRTALRTYTGLVPCRFCPRTTPRATAGRHVCPDCQERRRLTHPRQDAAPMTTLDASRPAEQPPTLEDEFVTLTVVVRRSGEQDDPCDELLANPLDVQFVGHQAGVSSVALALGADPRSWS
ncbi:DUF3145 family protein [Streptomyces sp. NPDC001478]